jgi:thioredoxin reductase (NADPH)
VYNRLDASAALTEKLRRSPVTLVQGIPVEAIHGNDEVDAVQLKDGTTIPAAGVFIELGAKGMLQLATALGVLLDDEMRYIRTDKQQATNIPGIYAAGDVCGPPWQMAKAVGEGCVAGINAAQFARQMKKTG